MKKSMLSRSALSSGFILAAMTAAAPAWAQASEGNGNDQPTCLPDSNDPACRATGANGDQASQAGSNGPDITVTGSRIRRPNLESTVPITSIGGESVLPAAATPNIGETLNELPQLRSTFAQQNPGLGIGIAGLNLLDLRGLGTSRTLVLVNGRRHVAADILNNAVSVDINTIPNDLIERVDVVTGGNSAVYGSDAIAGVVNFVLRRDYDGIQMRGQAGVTEQGFGGNQYRLGHVRQELRRRPRQHHRARRIFAPGARVRLRHSVARVRSTASRRSTRSGRPGQRQRRLPGRAFLRDHPHRQHQLLRPGSDHPAARPNAGAAARGIAPNNGATEHGRPAVQLHLPVRARRAPDPADRHAFGTGLIGGIIGGNGQTGREGQLCRSCRKSSATMSTCSPITSSAPAFELFVEAKWSRVNAVGNNAGPSFIQGTVRPVRLPRAHPSRQPVPEPGRPHDRQLDPASAATLASGCRHRAWRPLHRATAARAPAARSTRPTSPRSTPAPTASSLARHRSTWASATSRSGATPIASSAACAAPSTSDWNYEAVGQLRQVQADHGHERLLDRQRFLLSLDAGRNPVTGADPVPLAVRSGRGGATIGAFRRRSRRAKRPLAADIAACVPYNPFGAPDNSAAVDYFARNDQQRSRAVAVRRPRLSSPAT